MSNALRVSGSSAIPSTDPGVSLLVVAAFAWSVERSTASLDASGLTALHRQPTLEHVLGELERYTPSDIAAMRKAGNALYDRCYTSAGSLALCVMSVIEARMQHWQDTRTGHDPSDEAVAPASTTEAALTGAGSRAPERAQGDAKAFGRKQGINVVLQDYSTT